MLQGLDFNYIYLQHIQQNLNMIKDLKCEVNEAKEI